MQDLIKDIEKLEAISKKLEPGTELLKDWNQKVNAYGLEFVQGLDAGKAYEQYDGQELDFLDFGPEGDSIDNALEKIKSTVLNSDGRPDEALIETIEVGNYELVFHVEEYFRKIEETTTLKSLKLNSVVISLCNIVFVGDFLSRIIAANTDLDYHCTPIMNSTHRVMIQNTCILGLQLRGILCTEPVLGKRKNTQVPIT